MAEHNTLTGSQLHEPKGADTATADQVYISDGAGSGAWTDLTSDNIPNTTTQGIYDYNDLTTASTPIALTSAATQYELTNDGAGANTNTTYALDGITDMWDVATDRFDFTGLTLGDTVDVRFDVEYTTTTTNTAVNLDIEFGVGATPYQVNIVNEADKKAAGTYQVTVQSNFYMGNTLTMNNPARVLASADKTGVTVKVNGWYIRPLHNN